jgi:hypothetical protein
MGHLVWNATQDEAAHAGHPSVANHDQVGGGGGSDSQQFLTRVPTNAVRLCLNPGTISTRDRLVAYALGLSMNSLVHFYEVNRRSSQLGPGRGRRRDPVCMDNMQAGSGQARQLDRGVDRDIRAR